MFFILIRSQQKKVGAVLVGYKFYKTHLTKPAHTAWCASHNIDSDVYKVPKNVRLERSKARDSKGVTQVC